MNKPVGWFEIYVRDMQRAKAFYESVFDMRLDALDSPLPGDEMYLFPGAMEEAFGTSGALVKSAEGQPGSGGTIVYFSCDDCANEASRATDAGGKVLKEKVAIGEYGFAALVADTEGNPIGLHSMK